MTRASHSLIIGILTAVFWICVPHHAQLSPQIRLAETTWDAGKVYPNDFRSKEIVIFNDGDSDLVINDLSKTCGCLVPLTSPITIQPQSQILLPVTFESGKVIGAKTRTLVISSNDPTTPQLEMTIKGEVVTDFLLEPPYLFFSDLKLRDRRQASVVIKPTDSSRQYKVREALSSSSSLLVTLKPDSEQPGTTLVDVVLEPIATWGFFDERILLTTDSPNQDTLVLQVRGLVRGDVTLKPNRLYYKVVEPDKELERTIDIVNTGADPLTITSIDSDLANLVLEITTLEQGTHYRILAKLRPPFTRGRINGMIAIKTTDQDQSDLVVTVSGFVKPTYEEEY